MPPTARILISRYRGTQHRLFDPRGLPVRAHRAADWASMGMSRGRSIGAWMFVFERALAGGRHVNAAVSCDACSAVLDAAADEGCLAGVLQVVGDDADEPDTECDGRAPGMVHY